MLVILSRLSWQFTVPNVGNNELQQAINAAIAQMRQSGYLDLLYQKYFGYIEEESNPIFGNLFASSSPSEILIPDHTRQLFDCLPELQKYPSSSQIIADGALSTILTNQKLYVQYSKDAPGFFATHDSQRVNPANRGFEHELLEEATKLLSAHYLNDENKIQVVFTESPGSEMYDQEQFDYSRKTTARVRNSVATSTQFKVFAQNSRNRKFHLTAGGHSNTPTLNLGNYGCGTVVQEVGIMVNYEALNGLWSAVNNTTNFDDLKSRVNRVKSLSELNQVLRETLGRTVMPVCTKRGSFAHFQAMNQIAADQHYKHVVSPAWTNDYESLRGAFDQFINEQCVFFVAESATMLGLMKTLKEGASRGVYDRRLMNSHDGSAKYQYLFGLERVEEDEVTYRDRLAAPHARRTFVSSLAFIADMADKRTGNKQLNDVVSYAVGRYARQQLDNRWTLHSSVMRDNVADEHVVVNVFQAGGAGDAQTWLEKSKLQYIDMAQRQTMDKVYNIVVHSSQSQIAAGDVSSATAAVRRGFPRIAAFLDALGGSADMQLQGESVFNVDAYLLYSVFCDRLLQSRVFLARSPEGVHYANMLVQNYQYKDVVVRSAAYRFVAGDERPLVEFGGVPGTMLVHTIRCPGAAGGAGKQITKYNAGRVGTLAELYAAMKAAVDAISGGAFPDFLHMFDYVLGCMDEYQATDYAQSDMAENGTFSAAVVDAASDKNFLVIEANDSNTILVSGELAGNATSPFGAANTSIVRDFSGAIENFTGDAEISIDSLQNEQQFVHLTNVVPNPVNATTIVYRSQFVIDNGACFAQRTVFLKDIPEDLRGLYVRDTRGQNLYQEIQICADQSFPMALSQEFVQRPQFQPHLQLGSWDYIRASRKIQTGYQNNQIQREVLSGIAYNIYDSYGVAIDFQLNQNYLAYQDQVDLLHNNKIDLLVTNNVVMSGQPDASSIPSYANTQFGRNYAAQRIVFLVSRQHPCDKFIGQFSSLESYQHQHSCFGGTNITFCIDNDTVDFYAYFSEQYRGNSMKFSSIQKDTVQEMFNALIENECDFAVLQELQVGLLMYNMSYEFSYASYGTFTAQISPVTRGDIIDVQMLQFQFNDMAPLIMLIGALLITGVAILLLSCVCANLRGWIVQNNYRDADAHLREVI